MSRLIEDEWTLKHLEQAGISTGCLVLGLIGTQDPDLLANQAELEKAAKRASRAVSKYIEILKRHQRRKARQEKQIRKAEGK